MNTPLSHPLARLPGLAGALALAMLPAAIGLPAAARAQTTELPATDRIPAAYRRGKISADQALHYFTLHVGLASASCNADRRDRLVRDLEAMAHASGPETRTADPDARDRLHGGIVELAEGYASACDPQRIQAEAIAHAGACRPAEARAALIRLERVHAIARAHADALLRDPQRADRQRRKLLEERERQAAELLAGARSEISEAQAQCPAQGQD